jgi:hypothetical protein
MPESIKEFTSPEQIKKLFQHEAGELAVAYLLAVSKVWSLHRMLEIARRHFPELDEALSRRAGAKLEHSLQRFPQRYRDRTALHVALRELELAWDLDEDDVFLSTLRSLRAATVPSATSSVSHPTVPACAETEVVH